MNTYTRIPRFSLYIIGEFEMQTDATVDIAQIQIRTSALEKLRVKGLKVV